MSSPRGGRAMVMRWVLLVSAAALWTVLAINVLVIAWFAAADTRCNSEPPRVDMDGGWLVIATVCVWAAPFVVASIRRTSVVSVITAIITIGVGIAVFVNVFGSPDTFCF